MVLERKKMLIKETTNTFFDNPKGMIVDNSYDLYTLKCLLKYYSENKIEYLHSQDSDLSFLNHFSSVKFLSFSDEAIGLEVLNKLTKLVGVCLLSSQIKEISYSVLEKLEYLEVIFNDDTAIDFSLLKSLKKLSVSNLHCSEIKIPPNLEFLELCNCKKITNLDFLKRSHSIKHIKLDYLPKLERFDCFENSFDKIETLEILDCKRIKNFECVLSTLTNLRRLKIMAAPDDKLKFQSVSFIERMKMLKSFTTSYKIEDGNLKYLLSNPL